MPITGVNIAEPDRTYRPRVHAVLCVPVFGTSRAIAEQQKDTNTISVPIAIRKATLIRNNHHHADVLNISASYMDCGIDPRILKHCSCLFWIENVSASHDTPFELSNLFEPRFNGIATRVHRTAKDDDGFSVDMEFVDYTTLFIHNKPYPSKGMPTFSNTIRECWQTICDNTGYYSKAEKKIISSVAALRDRLRFDPPELEFASGAAKTLAKSVSPRLAKLGAVPVALNDKSDSWSVWQHVVQMLGYLSYIDGDECIVTNTTEHFSNRAAPQLIWGHNVIECEESCNSTISNKGVCLQSFDPIVGTTLEAFFPDPGDPRIRVKRSVARRKDFNPEDVQAEEYDYFSYPQVTVQDQLEECAFHAYNERSRLEMEGSLKTAEMTVQDADGNFFELLKLKAGDLVTVDIDQTDKAFLKNNFISESDRVEYLETRGYQKETALLIAKNLDSLKVMKSLFHVKQMTVNFDEDKFDIEIQYHNLIDIAEAAGLNAPDKVVTVPEVVFVDTVDAPVVTVPETIITDSPTINVPEIVFTDNGF